MSGAGFDADAVIIGGGFYGAAIAIYLAKNRGLRRVILLEKEEALLSRASYNNQARVHNGYHYPRSFTTAFRSRVNLPKFVLDWHFAVKRDFTKLYAIAQRNSKVTSRQFRRFCEEIGADIRPAEPSLKKIFNPNLIEEVFVVEEYAFDSKLLADWARRELERLNIEIRLETAATSVSQTENSNLRVSTLMQPSNRNHCPEANKSITTQYVFNCTYSGLNQLHGDFPGTKTKLKHEITEMALVCLPTELSEIGVTVMDGPFFSIMPFPARGLHTLSHVRYTPHFQFIDEKGNDPYQKLEEYERAPRVDRMLRDVGRYLPAVLKADYVESLFEIKTLLIKNEVDDGRPILFEKHAALPGCYSILGGKIDNIYDVFEKLDTEDIDNNGLRGSV